MNLFLSRDEDINLDRLMKYLPEGINEGNPFLEKLIERGFAVRSDGGYVYCTARGLKYLNDKSLPFQEHEPAPLRPSIWQKLKSFVIRNR